MTAEELKQRRAEYVKQRVESVKNKTTEIKKLSYELFVSQATIRRDLKR